MTTRCVGFDELARELSKMGEEGREKAYEVVVETARAIRREARRRVPVDLGDLKESIKVKENKKRLSARVEAVYPKSGRKIKKGSTKSSAGSRVYYALAVEYGTRCQREQPFLMPAAEGAEEEFVNRMLNVLEELLDGTR